MNRTLPAAGLASLLLLLAGGCSGPGAPAEGTVARVNDGSITLAELEYYFATNLLEETGDEALPVEEANAVHSRLLDALIDERILLGEARRHGIRVDDDEIDAYLAERAPESTEETADVELERQAVRRRLHIEKFQARIARELPPIDDEELQEYMDEQEPQGDDRELMLRALMLEDRETADRLHRDIKRRRITFNEAVVAHGGPAQGLPIRVSWNSLPEEVRQALDGQKAGRVSDPVEMLGSTYLFQIESWIDLPAEPAGETVRRASEELEQMRRRRFFEAVLDEARRKAKIRILRHRLPFDYVDADQP